jgi:lysyl-tRNA synthetase class 2
MTDLSNNNATSSYEETHSQEYRTRCEKLEALAEPYPNDLKPTHFCGDLSNEPPTECSPTQNYELAGRILFKRVMGKALFLKIQDFTGQIQCYARIQELGDDAFEALSKLDLGDCIWVKGFLFYTKTHELTLHICSYRLAVKCLRPLPDKFHGIHDPELKYRQRYLDLMTDCDSREVFRFRFQLVHLLREFFISKRYMEVETPMMHVIPGGANARPFITHHNVLDIPLYLRIAPELFLKRLVVGGFERVFEINRSFRNEGISSRHNPEFTMIEFYQAYATYKDMMDLTQDLFYLIAERFPAYAKITVQGQEFSLSDPIKRLSLQQTLEHFDGLTVEQCCDPQFLMSKLNRQGPPQSLGVLQLAYF